MRSFFFTGEPQFNNSSSIGDSPTAAGDLCSYVGVVMSRRLIAPETVPKGKKDTVLFAMVRWADPEGTESWDRMQWRPTRDF